MMHGKDKPRYPFLKRVCQLTTSFYSHSFRFFRCLYSLPGSPDCPVSLTRQYFAYLGPDWAGSVIPNCLPTDRNRPHPSRVSNYTTAKEDLQYVLQAIGEDPKGYAQHSMKRGGATEAARNGACVDDIRVAGDWTSNRTAELYIANPNPVNQLLRPYLL